MSEYRPNGTQLRKGGRPSSQHKKPVGPPGFHNLLNCFAASLILLIFIVGDTWASTGKDMTLGLLVGISGLGDQSFNDMTYAGLVRIKQEHNLKLIFEDSEKSDAEFEESLKRLLAKGAQIIVANGFYLKDLIATYAPKYPNRYFILQDAEIRDMPNVVCILYSVHEGSFLAGALAGMMTKTNKVGFIGGVDIPIMHVFRQGFEEGVNYSNPTAQVKSMFVTKTPNFSGFRQPDRGYRLAMETYGEGVDIIYAAAGLTGNGVLQAARKSGKFAIGVDSDQDHLAKGSVLTSMMKRLDIATYAEVRKILAGDFRPGIKQYGLKERGVGLSPMKFTHHLIPENVKTQLEKIKNLIVHGTIDVPYYLDSIDPGDAGVTR